MQKIYIVRLTNEVGDTLVVELCSAFLKERRGKVTSTQWDNDRSIVDVLVSLYGGTDVGAFDINCLRTVRDEFIQKRYVRKKINWRVRIVQFIFRWGVSYKIVPASVYHELKTLYSSRLEVPFNSFHRV